jgi:hypothetical protein
MIEHLRAHAVLAEEQPQWRAWRAVPDPLFLTPVCDLCAARLNDTGWLVEFRDQDRTLKDASGFWYCHTTWYFCGACYPHLDTHLALMALEGGNRE